MTSNLPATLSAALPATVMPLIVWDTTSVYGADGQFEAVAVSGAKLKPGATVTDLCVALAAVERSLLPCPTSDAVVSALSAMYATRRSRPGEQIDEEASLQVLAERVRGYPRDVLVDTGNHFIDSTPWMPAISEFLQVAERKMRPRRALKAALDQAIARAQQPNRPQLEAPKVQPTAEGRARDLIAYRRGKGDIRGAAVEERWLAHRQGRPVEAWAKPMLDEIAAEEAKRRQEFLDLAETERQSTSTPTNARLAELAQQRRDEILGGKSAA